MYYDPPQPRLLNSILTNGLTMQSLGILSGIEGHILIDIVASHCYLSSSYVKQISLHMEKIMVEWYWEMDWKLTWKGLSMCM